MLGGGKTMMNAYYQTAAKLGIAIAYESQVDELNIRGDEFLSARLNNGSLEIVAKALQPQFWRIVV